MKRPSELFSEADRKAIALAMEKAELNTSGEIVPVVAAASGRYDRAEDVFGLCLALAALTAVWLFFQDIRIAAGVWASGSRLTLGLLPVLAIIIAGFALGAAAATHIPVLKLPFVPKKEIDQEVERAAAHAFRQFRLGRTTGGTGILIYVSLLEHRVRVEGGGAISDKLSQQDWEEVCAAAVAGLKAGRPAEGLVSAIEAAGRLLARHFPIRPDDRNELKNELCLID
ncbi:MAG: TPM domain-containing protein [Elusimicrobiota bacterium]|nr:TPM domain-containing protein [Elusimicrobiota bacterium]